MTEKRETPEIQVGIFSGDEISFTLNGHFRNNMSGNSVTGKCTARYSGGKILLIYDEKTIESESPLLLTPENVKESSFLLHAVIIGVDFHWERKEDQVFKGSLKFIVEDNKITAVNVLSIEDYLTSVISSEMRATASEEFLKAHAVISRSWLLAQIQKSRKLKGEEKKYDTHFVSEKEIIKWYDREDHMNFDVCADDHCQRYQGITRASSPAVAKVIENTYGEMLTYDGDICDTRYYKCCGGMTELFESVWEPVNHPYLSGIADNETAAENKNIDLTDEKEAIKWISGKPAAFCNTTDSEVLTQVLNDYDQETVDFFRWKVTYTQKELSSLVKERTGIDFGIITGLVSLERGVSGRIIRLQIEGTKKTMIIGKELEIRKSLSKSHLYSSCFYVEKTGSGEVTTFILHGAGWGHGVGLCQIGAAVMGAKGYAYREILEHYFPGTEIQKLY